MIRVAVLLFLVMGVNQAKAENVDATVSVEVVGTSNVMVCDDETGRCQTIGEWIAEIGSLPSTPIIVETN